MRPEIWGVISGWRTLQITKRLMYPRFPLVIKSGLLECQLLRNIWGKLTRSGKRFDEVVKGRYLFESFQVFQSKSLHRSYFSSVLWLAGSTQWPYGFPVSKPLKYLKRTSHKPTLSLFLEIPPAPKTVANGWDVWMLCPFKELRLITAFRRIAPNVCLSRKYSHLVLFIIPETESVRSDREAFRRLSYVCEDGFNRLLRILALNVLVLEAWFSAGYSAFVILRLSCRWNGPQGWQL